MSTTLLHIPEKIKVGYQNRSDTYTSKLAYVIYYDEKGVLRKETSWQSWRDKSIEPEEFENVPTEGFVLNKGEGNGGGWHSRNAFIRVWDPRNFEIEVDLKNLLWILSETDCSRGKGLEGKFVYGWDKTNLVLVPVGTPDFEKSKTFTSIKTRKVKTKEMVVGDVYTTKDVRSLVYLGRYDNIRFHNQSYIKPPKKALFVFWNGEKFKFHADLKILAESTGRSSEEVANLLHLFHQSTYMNDVVSFRVVEWEYEGSNSRRWCHQESPTMAKVYYSNSSYYEDLLRVRCEYSIQSGFLSSSFPSEKNPNLSSEAPTTRLIAIFANGLEAYVNGRYDKNPLEPIHV